MNIIYFLLKKFFNEEKYKTILILIISFIINIFQINIISYITANIINSIQKNNLTLVYQYYKYFIIISLIYVFLYNFYKLLQNILLTKLRQWIRSELIKMILVINNENFSNINFTKLNSPINRISANAFLIFNNLFTYLIPNITLLLIITGYFLIKNKFFGILFLLLNLIVILYINYSWPNILEHNNKYQKYLHENDFYLVEILNNVDKIISRGQSINEINNFKNKSNDCINYAYKFYSSANYYITITNVLILIVVLVSIGYLIYLYKIKNINITIFITFFTILLLYRDKILTSIQQIPDFIEFIGRSINVRKTFESMNDDYIEILNKKYNNSILKFNKIKFENVSFSYNNINKKIFDNFNIELNLNNKIIGIIGKSGKGKSTFAKLIVKILKYEGNIYIDDKNINSIDGDYIRKNITYVNQTSNLFDRNIMDNILYGCDDKEYCNEHLNKIMRYEKINKLFKNLDFYNKTAGLRGENLSGGQRQVINIISGLILHSEIIILDEPTNALDFELKKEIIEIIKYFRNYKKCIIIISHDKDIYNIFDKTINF
jgi:ABC-type multidrug transport system fused ATPase/permease subunit